MRFVVGVAAALLASLVCAAPAFADVGYLPPQGIDGVDPTSIVPLIKDVIPNAVLLKCEQPRCIADATKDKPNVDEVLHVVVGAPAADKRSVTLEVFDSSGASLFRVFQVFDAAESPRATEALFRKAFDPARYFGTLEVRGVPPGAELYVDGLRLDGPRADLRVGQHELVVRGVDHIRAPIGFAIAFHERTAVDLPEAAPTTREPAARSPLPLLVSGSTALLGVAAAITFQVLRVTKLPADREDWDKFALNGPGLGGDNDPMGNDFIAGYGDAAENGAARGLISTAVAVNQVRGADVTDDLAVAGIVGGVTLAVVGTATALATIILDNE